MNIKIKENLKRTFFFSIFASLGVIFLLSLVSSSKVDNNFLQFNSEFGNSQNFLGYFGSVLSNFLLDLFGVASYLFCLFFFTNAFRSIYGNRSKWYSFHLRYIK